MTRDVVYDDPAAAVAGIADGSELVPQCTYPLPGVGRVSRVDADQAGPLVEPRGVVVRDVLGTDPDRLQDPLDVPLIDGRASATGQESPS